MSTSFVESGGEEADESSETVELGNESVLEQSMNSSALDVSQSAAIRSSRRRLKKGTAVVLNTDRLQKYMQKDKEDDDPESSRKLQMLGFKEQYKSKMATASNIDKKLEPIRRKLCILKLQKWYRKRLQTRADKYTQSGKWSHKTSDKVFALLLGYRVRYLMRSSIVIQTVKAQHDIQRILCDMCDTACSSPKGNQPTNADVSRWEAFRREVVGDTVDNLLLKYSAITHTDMIMAKSMCKQLLMERQKLFQLTLSNAQWCEFPPPGYWDLSIAIKKILYKTQGKDTRSSNNNHANNHQGTGSPARKLTTNKTNMETPPNVRRAVKISSSNGKPKPSELNLHKNNTHILEQEGEYFEPNSRRSPSAQSGAYSSGGIGRRSSAEDLPIQRLRHSGERPERAIEEHLLRTPENEQALRSVHIEHEYRPRTSPGNSFFSFYILYIFLLISLYLYCFIIIAMVVSNSGHKRAQSTSAVASSSPQLPSSGQKQAQTVLQRQRSTVRGHLQLHILSAEKLMPARKVQTIYLVYCIVVYCTVWTAEIACIILEDNNM